MPATAPLRQTHRGAVMIPVVIETRAGGDRLWDMYSRLLRDRIIMLDEPIEDRTASMVCAQLLFLQSEAPDKPAWLYINSPGGVVTAGLAIYDTMRHVSCPVGTLCMGQAASMGAVLLAAGLNLPDNVCGIVADCGYTSPREITRKCLPEYLPGMPLELTYAVGRLGAILFGHFDPEDADCEAAAAQSKVPILFVHGDADGFVPYDMGRRNYEACRAKGKKFLTVHGAEHAVSYYHDNDAYTKQATEFLQDCLAQRGFVWPPETDEPEK